MLESSGILLTRRIGLRSHRVGGVIVLMFFLYVTGIVFLLGAEVDALLEGRPDPARERPAVADLPTRLTPPGSVTAP